MQCFADTLISNYFRYNIDNLLQWPPQTSGIIIFTIILLNTQPTDCNITAYYDSYG